MNDEDFKVDLQQLSLSLTLNFHPHPCQDLSTWTAYTLRPPWLYADGYDGGGRLATSSASVYQSQPRIHHTCDVANASQFQTVDTDKTKLSCLVLSVSALLGDVD